MIYRKAAEKGRGSKFSTRVRRFVLSFQKSVTPNLEKLFSEEAVRSECSEQCFSSAALLCTFCIKCLKYSND